jgi:hypothetical protein
MLNTLFPTKTVDSVLSAFNKVLSDLQEVAAANEAEVTKQRQVILDAQASQRAAEDQISRANAAADKINALLGN